MGILSDLVIANEEDVNAILSAPVPSQSFDGLDIKGIDTVKLAMLHGILTDRTLEDLLPEYDPIAEASENGPWVFRLPKDLVEKLAQMSEQDRNLVSNKWAEIEEFALDGWELANVQNTLEAICNTAVSAESTGRGLYLWISL